MHCNKPTGHAYSVVHILHGCSTWCVFKTALPGCGPRFERTCYQRTTTYEIQRKITWGVFRGFVVVIIASVLVTTIVIVIAVVAIAGVIVITVSIFSVVFVLSLTLAEYDLFRQADSNKSGFLEPLEASQVQIDIGFGFRL